MMFFVGDGNIITLSLLTGLSAVPQRTHMEDVGIEGCFAAVRLSAQLADGRILSARGGAADRAH